MPNWIIQQFGKVKKKKQMSRKRVVYDQVKGGWTIGYINKLTAILERQQNTMTYGL